MSKFIAIIKFLFLLSLCVHKFKSEGTGVALVINEKFITEAQKRFLPQVIEKIKNLNIPDQSLEVDVKVGTVYINLSKIKLNLNFTSDDIKVTLMEPNIVQIGLNNTLGTGQFDMKSTFWKMENSNNVQLIMKKFKLDSEIQLTFIESKVNQGKLLPSGVVTQLNLDMDFDFEMSGSIIATIADTFKELIKSMIKGQIQTEINNLITTKSKQILVELVSNQTVFYNLTDSLSLDYSLISAPKVDGGNLILNTYGILVNRNLNVTNPNELTNLDLLATSDKSIRLLFSQFSINTALNTLFYSDLLKISFNTDQLIIPGLIFKMDTTSMDVFFYGLSKKYGKDKKIEFLCDLTSVPNINILKENFNATLNVECAMKAESETENYEVVMKFAFSLFVQAGFKLQSGGILNAHIDALVVDNSQMSINNLEGADIKYVEQFLDFATELIIPMVNQKYLSNVNLPLPEILNISIKDSEAYLEEKVIYLGVTPQYSDLLVDLLLTLIDLILPQHIHQIRKIDLENVMMKFLKHY